MESIQNNQWVKPVRKILTKEDLERFLDSPVYNEIMEFTLALNESVKGLKNSDEVEITPIVQNIEESLDTLINLVDQVPPEPVGKSRFGNFAFRSWLEKVQEITEDLQKFVQPKEALIETTQYLIQSFGNARRVDYGTGHEANFIGFLLCLKKLNLLTEADYPALVLKVFLKYLQLMRKLQFTYWLEPAGSHGVWGLDDYHFLPFMFGSSQLIGHPHIKPKSIHNTDILELFSKEYMYLSCIEFVNSVKTASLRWHSPMLDDISGVKTWNKVNEGMVKMHKGEVFGKLPIMQHYWFGSLLPFESDNVIHDGDDADEHGDNCDHPHVYAMGQEAPTCCGMRIPSAIGASQMNAKERPLRKVNPTGLPFD